MSGDAQPLASGVSMEPFFGQVQTAASDSAVLAYVPGVERARGRLAWVYEDGRTDLLPSQPMTFGLLSISPEAGG